MSNSQKARVPRILLIERDAAVRELLNEVLVDANYRVLVDEHPLDPAQVSNVQPDLIVLNVPIEAASPELDFVSHVKSEVLTTHIPILALCRSKPTEEFSAWAHQKGIAGLLLKPFDVDVFVETVQAILDASKLPATRADLPVPSVHHLNRGTDDPSAQSSPAPR